MFTATGDILKKKNLDQYGTKLNSSSVESYGRSCSSSISVLVACKIMLMIEKKKFNFGYVLHKTL